MLNIQQPDLETLEDAVANAIATGDESSLNIIGYGEITTVLLLTTQDGTFAVKRLPVVKSRANADHIAETIHSYVDALRASHVDVVPNKARIVERDDGSFVVYCVQEAVPEDALAANWFHEHSPEECLSKFESIADCIERSTSPKVTTDGQLSNWAFVGDELLYLDVSTPFLRHGDRSSVLDWRNYMGPVPAPLRWYYLREVPKVLDKYYDLRGQMLDFLGNLRKEKLDYLTPSFTDYVNDRFRFNKPLTAPEIQNYYTEDAKLYLLIERLRKLDRWVQRRLLFRTYPYLLAPDVDRNLH